MLNDLSNRKIPGHQIHVSVFSKAKFDKYWGSYTRDVRKSWCRSSCKDSCYCCVILTKTGTCGHILVKLLNIEFHENSFLQSSNRCIRRDEQNDRQTDMAKFTSAFLQFLVASMPKITEKCIGTVPTASHPYWMMDTLAFSLLDLRKFYNISRFCRSSCPP
jgi:hypothetical protein